jgi:hypothetical protein
MVGDVAGVAGGVENAHVEKVAVVCGRAGRSGIMKGSVGAKFEAADPNPSSHFFGKRLLAASESGPPTCNHLMLRRL